MVHLFTDWERLKKDLVEKYIILFLDYDGTLTPIVKTPPKARIPNKTQNLLRHLSKSPRCKLAIISGRALKDIKNIVGLKNIIYSGNHGLEIEGPRIKFKSPASCGYKTILQQIKNDLSEKFFTIKGTFLENKGLSLSLHYRSVDKKNIPQVKTIFNEVTMAYRLKNKIRIKFGKRVFEITPPIKWDKGKAVLWLLRRQRSALKGNSILPVYIGDDVTDEDAFKALRNKGLTVFVGKKKTSSAKYYLKSHKEVTEFLKRILNLQR